MSVGPEPGWSCMHDFACSECPVFLTIQRTGTPYSTPLIIPRPTTLMFHALDSTGLECMTSNPANGPSFYTMLPISEAQRTPMLVPRMFNFTSAVDFKPCLESSDYNKTRGIFPMTREYFYCLLGQEDLTKAAD